MGAPPKQVDLVTGGAGFLGSHLAEKLVGEGRNVVVVDSLDAGSKQNLLDVQSQIEFVNADTRTTSWWGALEHLHVSRVFHLAANASVPRSSEDPRYDMTTNILGTLNLLELARAHGAAFIYISSAAVYGSPRYIPTDEGHPAVPISFYGTSKLAGEHYVDLFHREYGLDTRIIRYFNCFGPRQPRYIVFDFLKKALSRGDTFEVLGTGEQRRTQLYASDAVTATLLVASAGDHEPYNVGSETSFTVMELAHVLLELTGQSHKEIVTTGSSWQGDIYTLIPDTTRLKALGFQQTVSLHQGLEGTFEWWKQSNA